MTTTAMQRAKLVSKCSRWSNRSGCRIDRCVRVGVHADSRPEFGRSGRRRRLARASCPCSERPRDPREVTRPFDVRQGPSSLENHGVKGVPLDCWERWVALCGELHRHRATALRSGRIPVEHFDLPHRYTRVAVSPVRGSRPWTFRSRSSASPQTRRTHRVRTPGRG